MNIKKIILISLLVFSTFAFSLKADTSDKEKTVKFEYNNAKKLILKKRWNAAIKLLENITKNNGANRLKDKSLYWLAYSLKKNAKNIADREIQVETLESAIEKLNNLIQNFPSSNWADDGEILRIEIAEALIKRGLSGYKKIIEKSSEKKSKENIKLYALDALLNIEDARAFPLLKKMIESSVSLKLKKRAVFVLSQQRDKRVLPLLAQIALAENPFELKDKAIFWIGQINGKEGLEHLLEIYSKSRDEKIRKKIIFSISQTGKMGTIELIKLYKLEKSIELKKKLLFWIGQSKSKAAADFLNEVLFD